MDTGIPLNAASFLVPPNLDMIASAGDMSENVRHHRTICNDKIVLTSCEISAHTKDMSEPASKRLKALRERAGLTVRETARLIGKQPSTYSSYEDKYKKRYLPIDLINLLIPIFTDRGIDPDELLNLSGVTTKLRQPNKDSHIQETVGNPTDFDISKNHRNSEINQNVSLSFIDELDIGPGAASGGRITSEVWNDDDGNSVDAVPVLRQWVMPPEIAARVSDSHAEQIKIVTVRGASMSPDYYPGDKVMVDIGDKIPSPPGNFIVWDGLNLVIKFVQYLPHSDPPKVLMTSRHTDVVPYERVLDEAYIQGRVIGKWTWS